MSINIELHIPDSLKQVQQTQPADWQEYTDFLSRPDSSFTTTTTTDEILRIKETRAFFSKKSTLVHIGIGGSSLGTKTIIEALAPKADIIFLENIECQLTQLFDRIDLEKTLFHIVSKSGETIEVIAHLKFILKELSLRGVTPDRYQDFFLLTSSKLDGELNNFQEKYHLRELYIPKNLGGRYSALSAVGLFPAHFYGLNIEKLVQGASNAKKYITEKNVLDQLGSIHANLYQSHSIDQNILMSYDGRLSQFNQWYCQLWGESLGKKKNDSFIGITPIASLGPRDQHSLLQLYLHGPPNKLITFISIENHDFELYQLVNDLQKGCEHALSEVNRPYYSIQLENLNEEVIGELIQLFHYLVVNIARKLGVYPYDQPAVELAKSYTRSISKKLNL